VYRRLRCTSAVTWNYRVIRFDTGAEPHLSIHEVYYDADGKPNGYAESPASLWWYENEDAEAPVRMLERMREALGKDVLTEKDFGKD
jgi:hypothetical protein